MTADLVGLADHAALLTKVRDASKANGGVRSIDFGKESGDAFIAALSAAIDALQLRALAGAEVGGTSVADVAISWGNFGQEDGSTLIGWRLSAETVAAMGMASMVMPKEIGEDLERLRAIATWWETGAKERMAKLQLIIENSFPNDRILRRGLWDAILPLIHAIVPPPGSGRGGVGS